MRLPGLSTLSARIIFGFASLIITFGVVTAVVGGNMYLLSRQIRVIPNGYLQLALVSKDLVAKQKSLRDYLVSDLEEEASGRRVRQRLNRYRDERRQLLDEANATLAQLEDTPVAHRAQLREAAEFLSEIKNTLSERRSQYDALLAAPPIERFVSSPGAEGERLAELERASEALAVLRRQERSLYNDLYKFSQRHQLLVENTARRLADNERKVRIVTTYLGLIAIAIGLLISIWVTLGLRPLRRLPQAARRIARGDYASRIEEKGPREVADLAHEFNVMGRAIEERERELVRSERLAAVGTMAAMITHEVRNPLASISLNTELLDEEIESIGGDNAAEARSLCSAIGTEVDRLTAITEEYLKFARLPKPKLRKESVNDIIENTLRFQREELRSAGVAVETNLAEALPAVMVDEAQLRQALLNLLRNASEALEEVGGGTVTIETARCSEKSVELVVRDDGPGIPKELADKLFDPFVSTKERGTGLGLALSHQIISEHGGTMSVDSAPGQGTTFRLELQIAAPGGAPKS